MGDYPKILNASTFNDMLFQLSRELTGEDLGSLKHLCAGIIPGGPLGTCKGPMDLLKLMSEEKAIRSTDTSTLSRMLEDIGRVDLGETVDQWTSRQGTATRSMGSGGLGGGQGVSGSAPPTGTGNVHVEGVYAPGMQVQGNVVQARDNVTIYLGRENQRAGSQ